MVRRLFASTVLLALAAACANPPDKEMNRAQGAIDAARAAGADRYAPAELEAATAALAGAEESVAQGDYRLAFSQALDASGAAQAAARRAADQKANVRSETERALGAADAALADAAARLSAARNVRGTAAAAEALEDAIARTERGVQEARSALRDDDYLAARDALAGVLDRLEAATKDLNALLPSRLRR